MTRMRTLTAVSALLAALLLLHGTPSRADFSAPNTFVRGDSNHDGRVDMSDAILTLSALFLGEGPLACPDAADANDSGRVDVSDPIHTLAYLFGGGSALPPPFPKAGLDSTPDTLDCFPASLEPEPPRPVTAEDIDSGINPPDIRTVDGDSGAIEVSPDVFDFLAALPDGASLQQHAEGPGVVAFMDALMTRVPTEGSPAASPGSLTAPVGINGCYRIDPEKLRGRTHDTGDDATPESELRLSVDPDQVCGLGQHVVLLTVTDREGNSATAPTTVTLCSDTGKDCVETLSETGPPFDAPPQSSTNDDMTCAWVVSRKVIPNTIDETLSGTYYDEGGLKSNERHQRPLVLQGSALELYMQSVGPGPDHSLFASRANPRCNTPKTDLKLGGWGTAIFRMNVLCFRGRDCVLVGDPSCASRADVEGSYQGAMAISTSAGEPCLTLANPIEALAQEEATLQVNDTMLFSKALTYQNGNRIQKVIQYQVAAGVGITPEGGAANFGINVGTSQSVTQSTGFKDGVLNSLAGSRFPVPVLAHLDAEGRAEIQAEGQANGIARAHTKAFAMYAWGVSNCPHAGYASVLISGGRAGAYDAALDEARDFFFQRTGSDATFQTLTAGGR